MEIENYCQTLFGCLVAQYFVKTAIPEFHCHVVNFFLFCCVYLNYYYLLLPPLNGEFILANLTQPEGGCWNSELYGAA